MDQNICREHAMLGVRANQVQQRADMAIRMAVLLDEALALNRELLTHADQLFNRVNDLEKSANSASKSVSGKAPKAAGKNHSPSGGDGDSGSPEIDRTAVERNSSEMLGSGAPGPGD